MTIHIKDKYCPHKIYVLRKDSFGAYECRIFLNGEFTTEFTPISRNEVDKIKGNLH